MVWPCKLLNVCVGLAGMVSDVWKGFVWNTGMCICSVLWHDIAWNRIYYFAGYVSLVHQKVVLICCLSSV